MGLLFLLIIWILFKRQDNMSQKLLKFIKYTNIITSVAIIAFGLTGVIFVGLKSIFGGRFFMVFSPIFMTLFGVILLATECKVDFIIRRVGFLRSLVGRGIFNIYLASQVFYYFSCGSGDELVGWIFGVILFLFGLLYIFLQFCAGSAYTEQLKERLS